MAATCVGLLMRFPLAIFDVQARRTTAAQSQTVVYRKGIGRICGAFRAPATAIEPKDQ
jgi:hypothetical protein